MGPTILLIFLSLICVIAYLYFYLSRPMAVKNDELNFLLNKPIAHRGLHCDAEDVPENSLKAFTLAIEKNYPIEIDVHLTKDDQVVVLHDDTLDRVTGVAGKVQDFTLASLKKLTLGKTQERIPTLKETLCLVAGRVPLLIEFKGLYQNGKLESIAYDDLKKYGGRYAVQSFDFRKVQWFKKHANNVFRGQLAMDSKNEKQFNPIVRFIATNMLTNFLSRPHFASYRYCDINKYAYRAFNKKGKTLLWTVTNQRDADNLLNGKKPKCNNIIFQQFIPENKQ